MFKRYRDKKLNFCWSKDGDGVRGALVSGKLTPVGLTPRILLVVVKRTLSLAAKKLPSFNEGHGEKSRNPKTGNCRVYEVKPSINGWFQSEAGSDGSP